MTDQIYPPGGPAYDSALDSYYSYNPAKAKQLLAAAGYPNGFTLAMPEDTGALGAENYTLIAQQLSAIGIKVNYTNYQTAQFFDAMLAPKFPATFLIFQQDPNPWQEAQYVTSPTAEWNPFHTTNATVNGYVKTMQTGSASAAAAAAKSLNQYLVQNAWYAPFYRPQSTSSRTRTPRSCCRTTASPTCGTSRRNPDRRAPGPPAGGPGAAGRFLLE